VQPATPRTTREPSSFVILDVTLEHARFGHSARSQPNLRACRVAGRWAAAWALFSRRTPYRDRPHIRPPCLVTRGFRYALVSSASGRERRMSERVGFGLSGAF
jgi:hypothetical protein